MGDVAQLNLTPRGEEARLRALMEDVVEYHKGVYPQYPLALAVWFGRTPRSDEHFLLELFKGTHRMEITGPTRFSLYWKTDSQSPPFVSIYASSLEYFTQELLARSPLIERFFHEFEVLHFDKKLLDVRVLQAFNILTEPPGLTKGWYVSADEFAKAKTVRSLLTTYGQARPYVGLVKLEESADYESCRGLLHIEVNQRWLPLTMEGLRNYAYYNDALAGRPGYLLFEGGSLYQIQKCELKTAPEYSARVLERARDDRYPEIYLRTVHPTEQPTA